MSVEQYERLLELLGGVGTIGIGALIAFVVFKLIIYLSTTGAVVYCIKLIVVSVKTHLDKRQQTQIDLTKNPPPNPDVTIKDMVINDTAYESLCSVLSRVRSHTNRDRTSALGYGLGSSGRWLHSSDVKWLSAVVEDAICKELDEETKKNG